MNKIVKKDWLKRLYSFLLSNVVERTKTSLEQLLVHLSMCFFFRLPTFDDFASNSLAILADKVNSHDKYNHC